MSMRHLSPLTRRLESSSGRESTVQNCFGKLGAWRYYTFTTDFTCLHTAITWSIFFLGRVNCKCTAKRNLALVRHGCGHFIRWIPNCKKNRFTQSNTLLMPFLDSFVNFIQSSFSSLKINNFIYINKTCNENIVKSVFRMSRILNCCITKIASVEYLVVLSKIRWIKLLLRLTSMASYLRERFFDKMLRKSITFSSVCQEKLLMCEIK